MDPATPHRTRWGIVSTGDIAATIAAELDLVPGAVKQAVSSRSLPRAREFADRFAVTSAYADADDLFADPDVDVVYLATPHAQHHALAARAIAAGKPVLIEKAFTCTQAAAADLADRARAAGVFVMEAMWARFQPGMAHARRLVADGAIGQVRAVHADLGFVAQAGAGHRLLDPAAGGGALLDLGVYVTSFAQWYLGAASSVHVVGAFGPTGVDVEAGLLLGYPDGAHAVLSCSLTSASPGQAVVVGTAGRVIVPPRFHHPGRVVIERLGHDALVVENGLVGKGYTHELAHVAQCLQQGRTESPVMPLADTVEVMRVLDRALTDLGAPHADDGFPDGGRS